MHAPYLSCIDQSKYLSKMLAYRLWWWQMHSMYSVQCSRRWLTCSDFTLQGCKSNFTWSAIVSAKREQIKLVFYKWVQSLDYTFKQSWFIEVTSENYQAQFRRKCSVTAIGLHFANQALTYLISFNLERIRTVFWGLEKWQDTFRAPKLTNPCQNVV